MNKNYDVVVVGGGLMGCSVAFQLASKGLSVAVIERNLRLGMETTARSGAIIRAHYGVPELVVLAHAANKRYLRFADEVGYECGFVQCGYSVIVDQNDVQALKSITAMQRDFGVDVSLLNPVELQEVVPSLYVDDIALASFEPNGGYAKPNKTVAAYAQRAEELGATFYCATSVTEASQVADGWSVTLSTGEILGCENAVLTTGNWSRPVGRLFGIDLPVAPVRAKIVVVERPDGATSMPVVSDLINLAYFREELNGGMWVGSSDMSDLQEKLPQPECFDESADAESIISAVSKTSKRFHAAGQPFTSTVQRSFAGLYETTPDWQPIIDKLPNNLHVAVGFSGHGFKLAPVIGDVIASSIIGSKQEFDTSIFRLSRFAEDRPIKSSFTYQRAKFLR
jgi:sarcosine oxidase, subunit beta